MSLWSIRQSRSLWQSGDQWIFNSGLSHMEPLDPSCGYFPSSKRIIGIDILSNWQSLDIDFLTSRIRDMMVEKAK